MAVLAVLLAIPSQLYESHFVFEKPIACILRQDL
jgi:hypothetical protein